MATPQIVPSVSYGGLPRLGCIKVCLRCFRRPWVHKGLYVRCAAAARGEARASFLPRHREEETAPANRDVEVVLYVMASWEPGPAEGHVGWVRVLWEELRRYATGGVYVNFLTEEEGTERLKAAYRDTSYVVWQGTSAAASPARREPALELGS